VSEPIPDDIRETAWSLVCGSGCITDVCTLPGCGCFDNIARALLAERLSATEIERKRCASIAEAYGNVSESYPRGLEDLTKIGIRRGIAFQIGQP
jgi:hypothetical protein